ncbi:MAG: glutaredoxin-like protein [Candidatus Binatia bacterium]|nr:MAG: glutaredoxin-like protein [Candidatus Binatia bacterium]
METVSLTEELRRRIESLIRSHDVVLFMKGNRMFPQCGFSARVVQILDQLLPDYATVDVLEDPEIREGIKEYSCWPTIPQLYIRGEFIGGCDIVTDLYLSGELHKKLGLRPPERKVPNLRITEAAAKRIREYLERAPDKFLHLSIDPAYRSELRLGPRHGGEIEARSEGISVLMDPATAERAEGVSIDVVETETGVSFRIENPNAPRPVPELSPREVQRMREEGVRFEFVDCRTPEERAIAKIEGTRLLDDETVRYLESLPKDTMLVFHCHHGVRSLEAAERFRSKGFRNVYSLAGGIDAWSREVDPSVPRY